MGYRKIERVDFSIGSGAYWKEVGFDELAERDLFKITDLDDNNKISIDGEDGTSIFIATSLPYLNEEKVYTIDTEVFEGTEDEIFESYVL